MENAEYMRSYYWKNREAVLEKSRKRNAEKRRILNEHKAERGCKECGITDWRVLDFHHHENNKEFNVANSIGSLGIKKLMQEAEKCEVMCANCHRIEHAAVGY